MLDAPSATHLMQLGRALGYTTEQIAASPWWGIQLWDSYIAEVSALRRRRDEPTPPPEPHP